MFPQTLALEFLLQLPPVLIFIMIASQFFDRGSEAIDFLNAKGRDGTTTLLGWVQNHADWDVLLGLLQGQLDALYVQASAERGEFASPSPTDLERFFAHAQAVGAGARRWELDLPKPYLWARRFVGLALGIGWFHAVSSGLDWLDHAGDAVVHGLDALHFGGGVDVQHAAGLFDLESMLHGGSAHVSESGFELPDPHGYGLPSVVDGDLRVNPVHGYFRDDGTFVRAYWRGARG